MKDRQIQVQIEQLAGALLDEQIQEDDPGRSCRLQDTYEYIRRAWWAIEGAPTEDNDTSIETQRQMMSKSDG